MICDSSRFIVKTFPVKVLSKGAKVSKFEKVQNLFLVGIMSKWRLPDPGRIAVKLSGNGGDGTVFVNNANSAMGGHLFFSVFVLFREGTRR